eukprot:1700942-Pyramimonas_sp.AAC.1
MSSSSGGCCHQLAKRLRGRGNSMLGSTRIQPCDLGQHGCGRADVVALHMPCYCPACVALQVNVLKIAVLHVGGFGYLLRCCMLCVAVAIAVCLVVCDLRSNFDPRFDAPTNRTEL